jgi:hypothetical protein
MLNSIRDILSKIASKFLDVRPIRVLSCCSGVLTEAFAAAALGIKISVVVCDSDAACRNFSRQAHGHELLHYFPSMACLEGDVIGGDCSVHSQYCTTAAADGEASSFDLLIAGPPCQPYSKLSGSKAPPETHPLFSSLFTPECDDGLGVSSGSLLAVIRKHRPKFGIVEQVAGFSSTFKGRFLTRSPLLQFVDCLKEIVSEDGSQFYGGFEAFQLDAGPWIEMSRPRIALCIRCVFCQLECVCVTTCH